MKQMGCPLLVCSAERILLSYMPEQYSDVICGSILWDAFAN